MKMVICRNPEINYRLLSERLSHPYLPENIIAAYQKVHVTNVQGKKDVVENVSGGTFVKKIADQYLGVDNLNVVAKKYEKPRAYHGEREISISFSHTNLAISAAVSSTFNVGCDMESVSRKVHDRLQNRIKQNEEADSLYKNNEPIRIWTLKEAALKMIGTGLRKPMNCVRIKQNSEALFFVLFDDGKRAEICSFKHQDYWISICYHKQP